MSNLKLTSSSQNWEISAARIYNPNSSLTLDASGNYSLLLKTNGTTRLTINGAGLTTFGTLGSYDPTTNFFTGTKFVGDCSGNSTTSTNATNATNAYVDNSSLSNITYYPTFASTYNSNVLLKADTDYTYNPSTNILSVPTINATSGFQKGATAIVSMVFGSISFSASGSTTPTSYTLNMPSGCSVFNIVSWNPATGVNNYLTIYDWSLGDWSGPLTTTQIRITAALGNGVHLDPYSIQFYWRI